MGHVLRVLGRSVIAGSPSRYLSPSRLSCVPLWSICCGVSAVETLRRLQVCIREKKGFVRENGFVRESHPGPGVRLIYRCCTSQCVLPFQRLVWEPAHTRFVTATVISNKE